MTDDHSVTVPTASVMDHALAAAARGWAVHPLAPGDKVPLTRRGFLDATTDPGIIRAWFAQWPEANYGIRTGSASGLYVADGDAPGAVEAVVGETQTMTVRTPHDGLHVYFRWEEGLRNTARRLAEMVDSRGEGGYVVGPGSVLVPGRHTCKWGDGCPGGKYEQRWGGHLEVEPISAPLRARLVQLAPTPTERPSVVDWAMAGKVAGSERAVIYAQAGLQAVMAEVQQMVAGARDTPTQAAARRTIELVNLGWPGSIESLENARAMFAQSAAANGMAERDITRNWESAARAVGQRPAVMPPDTMHGVALDLPDFPAPVAVEPYAATGGVGLDLTQFTASPLGVASPFEREVAARVRALQVDEEARRQLAAGKARQIDWASVLLGRSAVKQIAPLEPLITDWLFLNTIARLSGASGHYKSYVTIEMAACIASGRPWHGKATKQQRVVYVVAEGASGYNARLEAWETHHDASGELEGQLYTLTMPVQVVGPDWASFVAHLAALRPGLVVIDTQARVTVGLDENSATALGEFVHGLEALREATGACVLVVHHYGKSGAERGSSAVRGAMTTEIGVAREGQTHNVTVSCGKQKDASEPDEIRLTWQQVEGYRDATGRGNGVLVAAADRGTIEAGGMQLFAGSGTSTRDVRTARQQILVDVLREVFAAGAGGTEAAIKAAWLERVETLSGRKIGKPATRWQEVWQALTGLGRIAKHPTRSAFKFVEVEGLGDLEQNGAYRSKNDYLVMSE